MKDRQALFSRIMLKRDALYKMDTKIVDTLKVLKSLNIVIDGEGFKDLVDYNKGELLELEDELEEYLDVIAVEPGIPVGEEEYYESQVPLMPSPMQNPQFDNDAGIERQPFAHPNQPQPMPAPAQWRPDPAPGAYPQHVGRPSDYGTANPNLLE